MLIKIILYLLSITIFPFLLWLIYTFFFSVLFAIINKNYKMMNKEKEEKYFLGVTGVVNFYFKKIYPYLVIIVLIFAILGIL
jgi:hypothetical protein